MQGMVVALKQTQVLAAQLLEARESQDNQRFKTLLNLPLHPESESKIEYYPEKFFPKPALPIMTMNRNAIEQYFSGFIRKCYEFEGKKPRRIFGAKFGAEADPLDLYDATAEQILNR